MSLVKNSTALDVSDVQFIPQGSAPAGGTDGDLYYDDGTNTTTGEAGLMIRNSGVYREIPTFINGTWTPVIGDGTNNFTTTTALGFYTLIGKLMSFDMRLTWSSIGSASGVIQCTLPFSSITTTNRRSTFPVTYTNGFGISTGYSVSGRSEGTAFFNLVISVTSASGIVATDALFAAAGELEVSGTYLLN